MTEHYTILEHVIACYYLFGMIALATSQSFGFDIDDPVLTTFSRMVMILLWPFVFGFFILVLPIAALKGEL